MNGRDQTRVKNTGIGKDTMNGMNANNENVATNGKYAIIQKMEKRDKI